MIRLALGLFLILAPGLVKAAVCTAPAPTGQIRVDSPGVVDGDTLRASGQRLRLWGVQAPERGEPGYAEASRALQSITREPIKCNILDVDRYARPVVQCFNRRGDVAAQLIAAGVVVDWPRYSSGFYGKGCVR